MIAVPEDEEQHSTPESKSKSRNEHPESARDLQFSRQVLSMATGKVAKLPTCFPWCCQQRQYLITVFGTKTNQCTSSREDTMKQEENRCKSSQRVMMLSLKQGFCFWLLPSLLGYDLDALWMHWARARTIGGSNHQADLLRMSVAYVLKCIAWVRVVCLLQERLSRFDYTI